MQENSRMARVAGYSESFELTRLIEQLRERLSASGQPGQSSAEELEQVLSRLVIRNQRLRVLHRLTRKGGTHENEHVTAMRTALEQLDAQLLEELPALLSRLPSTH
jgi:hypothetical protein